MGPLQGLRIVELAGIGPGPFCGMLLADLGADVVKVESIQRPDGMRFAGSVRNETMWEWNHVFHGANTGKRDVTLNIDSPEGRELILRLIAGADVVAENFSARVLDHWGLGFDALHAHNPRLLLLRMPAFGLSGPWRDNTGFAQTMEQMSGLAWVTGHPEDQPRIQRGPCDPLAGMHAVFSLLVALAERHHKLIADIGSLHGLVGSMPFPVWARDRDGKLVFVNRAYAGAVDVQERFFGTTTP